MEYNHTQIPVAISLYLSMLGSKIFLLTPNLNNMEESMNKLWNDVFTYLIHNFKGVIFVYNLGSASP